MPDEFNEWVDAPNGTAPPDAGAYVPPGKTHGEQVAFCMLNEFDPIVGQRCSDWLKKEGLR